MTEEEYNQELERLDEGIDNLEKMYQHAVELLELDREEFDIDYDLVELRNTIDRKLTDYKSEKENVKGDLENLKDHQNEYLDYEYRKSTEAF